MSDQNAFDPPTTGGIVVGHDGSRAADRALTWAHEEAGLRQIPLHVVRGWRITDAPRPADVERGIVPSEDQFREAVLAELRSLIAEVLGETTTPIHLHAPHGSGEHTLVSASEGAALIVVASHGTGGVKSLLLGSTSEHVVKHAKCPVVVLRG